MHIFTPKSLFVIALLGYSQAFAAEAPEVAWINLFDGETAAGDNNIAVATVGSDNIYWLNTLGSTDTAPDLFYAGEKIFTGSPYSAGTSYANNIALTKTDSSGAALWTVYSNSGDYASGDGGMAVDADGSVVIVGKVRHTDGLLDRALTMIDAAGKTYSFGGTVDNRYYSLVMARISSDGAVEWIRTVEVAHGASPDGSKDFVADAVSAKAVAIDNDGNIYVGGSFSMPLTFTTSAGTATISARNAANWNGASQTACGDMFIARFDADGYYTGSIKADGNALKSEQILDLIFEDGKLYATGTALSDDESSATFGGKVLKADANSTPFVASLNTSLEVEWLSGFKAEKVDDKSVAWQNAHVTVVGNALWLTALANGAYSSYDDSSKSVSTQQGTQREGIIIKLDATNGTWLAAADSRDGFSDTVLGGYIKAIQNPSETDKVYVYGYLMNKDKGAFIRGYDAETLAAETAEDWYVVTGGGVPTGLSIAYEPSTARAYVTVRGNAQFNGIGGVESAATQKWAVAAARVDLPGEFLSGVEGVLADADSVFELIPGAGIITVRSTKAVTVPVYDLAGRVVAVLSTDSGVATANVAAGIYVAAGKKVLVK